jgi:hypothetical protein
VPLSPSFTFGLLTATLYGAIAHLLLGGNGRRLLFLILASWVGFAIGQAVGDVMDITVMAVGPTNLFAASLGSLLGIATTAILTARPSSQADRGR